MEACVMKPAVKKKPKPPKPPPKPTEMKGNEADRGVKPTPVIPPRPADAELTYTQYRMKRSAASNNETNGDIQQRDTRLKPSETPVVPPRRKEKEPKAATRHGEPRKTSRETDQLEAAAEETDFKRSNQWDPTGMFRRSQKEKTPTFTSYMTEVFDQEEKSADVAIKQAPSNKPASREPSPDPSAEETGSEKEQPEEENNVEHKRDKGGRLAGMFRKTGKERSSSPALKVSKADSDSEDVEKEEDKKTSESTHQKGGFFSGILKKSSKPADETSTQENLSEHKELSASSDSLSDNTKEKGIFSGIFRKSPKPAETDQDQQSLSGDLSGSNDNLLETHSKDKGFFNGILRKSPKIVEDGKHEQEKDVVESESSASNENLSENTNVKEKVNMFSGMFRRSPKPSEGLEEGDEPLHGKLSASSDSLSENKEKGGFFGLLRKTPKSTAEENLAASKDVSGSSDSLSEAASRKASSAPG